MLSIEHSNNTAAAVRYFRENLAQADYYCEKTNIIVPGKFNNMSVSNWVNCAIVVDSVISSVEIINGKEIKVQVNESCKQVIVDRSQKTGLYLSESAKDLKVNTTCSSTTFIHFPALEKDENENDERSLPVCESFVTKIVGDSLVTEPMDLAD